MNEIGLWLLISVFESFWERGITIVFLRVSGKIPSSKDLFRYLVELGIIFNKSFRILFESQSLFTVSKLTKLEIANLLIYHHYHHRRILTQKRAGPPKYPLLHLVFSLCKLGEPPSVSSNSLFSWTKSFFFFLKKEEKRIAADWCSLGFDALNSCSIVSHIVNICFLNYWNQNISCIIAYSS